MGPLHVFHVGGYAPPPHTTPAPHAVTPTHPACSPYTPALSTTHCSSSARWELFIADAPCASVHEGRQPFVQIAAAQAHANAGRLYFFFVGMVLRICLVGWVLRLFLLFGLMFVFLLFSHTYIH